MSPTIMGGWATNNEMTVQKCTPYVTYLFSVAHMGPSIYYNEKQPSSVSSHVQWEMGC